MPDPQIPLYMKALQLAIAGAAGTLARWGVYEACSRWVSTDSLATWKLAMGTLLVNIAGSFAFGLIWRMWEHGQVSLQTRIILLTGFMGAFTTFSSFAFDTGKLIAAHQYAGAAANILANNVLGIGAFFLGLWAGGVLFPRAA